VSGIVMTSCTAGEHSPDEHGEPVAVDYVTVAVSRGGGGYGHCWLPDGTPVLFQHPSPAEWAALGPVVAGRAPTMPMVEHLDGVGMRACLRAAAVDAGGAE
jgi:hypothetical protein